MTSAFVERGPGPETFTRGGMVASSASSSSRDRPYARRFCASAKRTYMSVVWIASRRVSAAVLFGSRASALSSTWSASEYFCCICSFRTVIRISLTFLARFSASVRWLLALCSCWPVRAFCSSARRNCRDSSVTCSMSRSASADIDSNSWAPSTLRARSRRVRAVTAASFAWS